MKKIIISIFVIIGLIALLVGIYFSPIGGYFLKNYLKEKLCLTDKIKITYFNYSLNSFSATLNNQDGLVQIFGTFFPLEISYNANFNDMKYFIPLLKSNLTSTGEIIKNKKNNDLLINGNYLYSKGYGNFKLNCINKKISGEIDGKNFDTKTLLNNISNFNFPMFKTIPLDGQNDIKIFLNKQIKIFANYKGNFIINDINVPIKAKFKMELFPQNNFVFNTDIFSSRLLGKIKGIKNNNLFTIKGILDKFDLKLIRQNLLYPLVGNAKFTFNYNDSSKLFSFKSKYFSGYKDKNINIQINMPLKKFFEFLNITPVLIGNISGNIIINNNKGVFNLLIENASFILNKNIKKLDHITRMKLENIKSIYFLNGSFDSQKIVFDFISKNPYFYIYLKQGIYYYGGLFSLDFDLKTKKNNYYKINLNNNGIKILKHISNAKNYDTLVY